jgi:hypothetical protein
VTGCRGQQSAQHLLVASQHGHRQGLSGLAEIRACREQQTNERRADRAAGGAFDRPPFVIVEHLRDVGRGVAVLEAGAVHVGAEIEQAPSDAYPRVAGVRIAATLAAAAQVQQRRPRRAAGAGGRERRIGVEQRADGVAVGGRRRFVDGHTR